MKSTTFYSLASKPYTTTSVQFKPVHEYENGVVLGIGYFDETFVSHYLAPHGFVAVEYKGKATAVRYPSRPFTKKEVRQLADNFPNFPDAVAQRYADLKLV